MSQDTGSQNSTSQSGSDSGELAKLKITNVTTNTSLDVKFNPTQLQLNKQVGWKQTKTKTDNVPKTDFGGGHPTTLSLELLFDTTDTGADVRTTYTNFLLDLCEIDTTKTDDNSKPLHEPPDCRLEWGSVLSLLVVVSSVQLTFTYFLRDGTPVRAKANLSFTQKVDESEQSAQNPTTRTQARKTRVVHAGDRLDWIAYQEYGNAAQWRYIAETNNLPNPEALRAGQVLKIVPLP